MINMNININKNKLSYMFSKISLFILIIMIIILIDIPTKFLPFVRFSTGFYFLPIYICPVTLLLAIISLMLKKNKIAYISLILNICIICLEIIFIIVGLRFLIH